MDYALLAATILGAAGLYLMLPRERAPLVRLGALLGVMALAGFFLYLVRLADSHLPGTEWAGRPPIYFYLFAAIMIASAVGVVCQPRPVYAALYFVLVTLAGAGLFVLLLSEFMAIVLIIIYAGAILVTYVFVIMLASQGSGRVARDDTGANVAAPAYDRRSSGSLIAVVVAFVLVGAITQVLLPKADKPIATAATYDTRSPVSQEMHNLMLASLAESPAPAPAATLTRPAQPPYHPSNVQLLGSSLYSQYATSLELAGILLTIALIGAVVIARKNTHSHAPLGTGQIPSQ
jgi:NADH-quinone oxidoreductase subunit J